MPSMHEQPSVLPMHDLANIPMPPINDISQLADMPVMPQMVDTHDIQMTMSIEPKLMPAISEPQKIPPPI